MKILLLGFGDVPPRYQAFLSYCENYIDRNTGGHEIVTFGYNKGTDITINPEDDFTKVLDFLPDGWFPDICVLWGVEWNLLPKGIEQASFPTVAVVFDPDYDLPLTSAIVQSTDISITVGEFEKEILCVMNANDAQVFYYQGLMRESFNPNPPPMRDRKYDILYTTFIDDEGHPDRSKWILKLSSLSDKYNICISPPVPNYKDYIELLQDSKLVLSHHRYGSMSLRILEAGAQGTVTLETGNDVKKYFLPGEEFIPVTEDNITLQIEKYLEDTKRLEKISAKVYTKVTKEYEARDRFVKLLDFIAEKLKDKKIARRRSLPDGERFIHRGEVYYCSFFRNIKGSFILDFTRFLMLSIEEFKRAVSIETTPRAVAGLATAVTTYGFFYEKDAMVKEGWKEVVSLLNKVISSYPSYAMAYFNLGLIHLRVNNFREALKAFNTALELFRNKEAEVDPWCMFPRDYDLFNLWKPLTDNRILLYMGKKKAEDNIRNLYQAAIYYYIYLMENEDGDVYKALEALKESHNLYPESGLVIKELANLLNILGLKKEGLTMYKKAIELLPLNVELRIDYINILYLYRMNKEILDEIRKILNITRTVRGLRDKTTKLKELTESFGEFNTASGYSHDSCRENILHDWVETLHIYLRKDSKNLNLVLRIIEIWHELGRVDKIFEILDNYITNHLDKGIADNTIFSSLNDIYNYLQTSCDITNKSFSEKLNRLKHLIDGMQSETEEKIYKIS